MTAPAETPQAPAPSVDGNVPLTHEVTTYDLSVTGHLPDALRGRYVRNGPNSPPGREQFPFLADGMVHGVELRDGRAVSYRNRWVRTPSLETGEPYRFGPDGTRDLTVGPANTSVVRHAGRVLACVESALPYQLRGDLSTVGAFDFGGVLRTAMTAHPKTCPVTGELLFFGYDVVPPYLTWHVADATGALVRSGTVDLPEPVMMHDFAITRTRMLFLDLPVVFDAEAFATGFPFRWSDEHGARIGVLPREPAAGEQPRWYDIEPGYVFHTLNAWDAPDGRVVLVGVRYDSLWRHGPADFSAARLHRWVLDLVTGTVVEERLDDRPVEFPRLDERRVGLPPRFGYAVGSGNDPALVRYDLESGQTLVRRTGGRRLGEAVHVPAGPAAAEDDGWLLYLVADPERGAHDLEVVAAGDLTGEPVARVHLPVRVPDGFHGAWLPDDA